ncbi:MAG TPA: hypothetical protein VKQ09_05715 [Sphingomonas sp.]|nr:hypothetical protein [Sphingomonas sp.]
MAFQQSDLDTLDAAIASGVLETRFADGRHVRYQEVGQMITARQTIVAQLAAQRGALRKRLARYRSGL